MKQINTKQVVVNGGETYGRLLTPKWVIEYHKRKGIELFFYLAEIFEDDFIYVLQDANELDDNTEIYHGYYLIKNIGDTIKSLDDLDDEVFFPEYDMFTDREDQTLIDIANEVNNTDLVKIIEIPYDVEYNIVRSECGFNEYIVEKHRTWY